MSMKRLLVSYISPVLYSLISNNKRYTQAQHLTSTD